MDKKSPDAFRTISEVAEWLGVPTHVLRFWESRFSQVKPVKRAGGRRYYRPADMELLGGIRKLLHEDGMTIRGVQKLLREQGVKHVAALSPLIDSQPAPATDQSNVVSFGAARDDSAEDQPTTEPAALAEHPAAQDAMPAPEQAAEQPATQVGALSTAQPLSPSGTGDAPEIPVDPLEPIPQEDPTIAEAMATAASEQRPPFPVESAPIDALFSGEEMPEAPATTSAPLPSAPPVPSQATDVPRIRMKQPKSRNRPSIFLAFRVARTSRTSLLLPNQQLDLSPMGTSRRSRPRRQAVLMRSQRPKRCPWQVSLSQIFQLLVPM